jgi:hypothetical protein
MKEETKKRNLESGENRPQIVASQIASSLEQAELAKQVEVSQTYKRPKTTIMDESLSKIIDNTLNFVVNSFDDYYARYSEAELLLGDHKETRGVLGELKINMHALVLFLKKGENIIYIGFLMILLSLIIFTVNISTS